MPGLNEPLPPDANPLPPTNPKPAAAAATPTAEPAAAPATQSLVGAAAESEAGEAAPAAQAVSVGISWSDLALPPGSDVPEATQKEFLDLVNGDLSPKARAEGILTLHERLAKEAATAAVAAWETTQSEWIAQTRALPEFSGDKFGPSMALVSRLLTKYGDKATREAFDLTGAGNHPAVVSLLHKLALAIVPTAPVSGAEAPRSELPLAQRLYGAKSA